MRAVTFCVAFALVSGAGTAKSAEKPRPLMRDFMGLCVHTVQFKPALYAPTVRLLRDYHPMIWDIGDATDYATKFPMARNGVDWSSLYGGWVKAGYRVDASIMFEGTDQKKWKDLAHDSFAYGKAFASYFGPSGKALTESMEIGNEPGNFSDENYRTVFENMARGAREGDPKLKVATCAVNLGPSGKYSKSVDCLKGLESLYDVVNIHDYAQAEGWPTWRRSYAEDPKISFQRELDGMLKWRDEHVPEKEVWLTEFGWDASTKKPPETGDFARWEGSTEEHQAEWTVRGYLFLAGTKVDRAYLYFFNDEDEPHVHGSSGLTRHFKPKPAFYAVAHLQQTLGDSRFAKAVRADADDCSIYEFQRGDDSKQRIWVVWKPHGPSGEVTLPVAANAIDKTERMPLSSEKAESVGWKDGGPGETKIEASEAPVYLWLK
jgi:hypothetical protein